MAIWQYSYVSMYHKIPRSSWGDPTGSPIGSPTGGHVGNLYGDPRGFLWDSYRIHGIPTGFVQDSYRIPIGFL